MVERRRSGPRRRSVIYFEIFWTVNLHSRPRRLERLDLHTWSANGVRDVVRGQEDELTCVGASKLEKRFHGNATVHRIHENVKLVHRAQRRLRGISKCKGKRHRREAALTPAECARIRGRRRLLAVAAVMC